MITPETGEVAGKATHTLFGRRKWDGETAPLLFAGQYEDTETGLVYNRYRYYNPHTATYTAQDPLGVGPNPATSQGYVDNPVLLYDLLGLAACGNVSQELRDVSHPLQQRVNALADSVSPATAGRKTVAMAELRRGDETIFVAATNGANGHIMHNSFVVSYLMMLSLFVVVE